MNASRPNKRGGGVKQFPDCLQKEEHRHLTKYGMTRYQTWDTEYLAARPLHLNPRGKDKN